MVHREQSHTQHQKEKKKKKELIKDCRKKQDVHSPLNINGERMEKMASFKFLGTHNSEDLTWTANTTALVKKAQ